MNNPVFTHVGGQATLSRQGPFAIGQRWHSKRSIAALLLAVVLLGCQDKQYDPIDRALAEKFQAPALLGDVERELGPGHEPTQAQMDCIQEVVQRMPERMRRDAEADRTLAWGNDLGFLVVKVNSKGTIWVASNRFGGPRPAGMKPPPIPPVPVQLGPPINTSQ